MAETTRSAFLALIGRPNVGKSSLLNRLVGQKVAIVSDKPQTTRNRIMGVKTDGAVQLVFLDTPGAHRPRTKLGDFMVRSIGEAMSGVDGAILVVEPTTEIREQEQALLDRLKKEQLPAVLVINKVDLVEKKETLLACIAAWKDAYDFDAILPLSAVTGEGVDALETALDGYAFESPHFFPDDAVTDQPERLIAAELIREKMLQLLQQEIPHGIAVVIERMSVREGKNGTVWDMEAYIYCERESHKGMIIGKKGAMLKEIGSRARADMEQLLDAKVNLQCWVKVKPDWRNRQGSLGEFGFTIEK